MDDNILGVRTPDADAINGARTRPPPYEQPLQDALRLAQANLLRYQELFDFAPDGYLVTDMQAVIQQTNHAAAALLGGRREFLVGKPLLFFVAESERRCFAERLCLLRGLANSRQQWEMTLVAPRGVRAPVLATAVVAPAGSAEIRWTLRDILLHRKAEQTLQAERDFADSLVEMAGAVILVVDGDGRIVRTNPYFLALIGRGLNELRDLILLDFIADDDRPAVRHGLQELTFGPRHVRGVHRLLVGDGRTRTLAWSARLLTGGSATQELVLIVGNDVTDLQEAQERALQAERLAAIGQMAAGLTHESRNAMQRTQACLAMLGFRLKDQPEAMELLARAQKAQEDLHRLYEDVREFAGSIRLERAPCNLADIWRQAWDDLGPARRGKDAVLVEEAAAVDLDCTASPFHLRQVFRNLFENALAAGGAEGRVTVRCEPAELDGREAVRVTVQDSGPGFTETARQHAFEVFFSTKMRGTGLGLAICKRILVAHGGRIALGESAGPGGRVLLTLPRRPT